MFANNKFTYNEYRIVSAAPVTDIKKYLSGLGAVEKADQKYDYKGLEIEVSLLKDDKYPDLGIPRHTITVNGEEASAEDFLTAYRFNFMSAGG